MTTEPEQQGEWGAPQPPPPPQRPKWTTRRTIIAIAVAVGIAAAGGIAIYAASGTAAAGAGPGQGGPGGAVVIGPGGGLPGGGFEETQHGDFQVGKITELTDKEITVKSDDGFTETYVLNDDTAMGDDVKKGDTVTVVARTTGETATATAVMKNEMVTGGPRQRQRN